MEVMNSLHDSLLVELQCPVCTNYMTPPIRQCENGHSICESCKTKLSHCPLCRKNFIHAKNVSLEALACKMPYPCPNQPFGCDVRLVLKERANHIKNCSFKGFKCAMSNCNWIGKLEDIIDHWSSKQPKKNVYQASTICQMKITKSGSYYINLVQAHNNLFWFKCRSGEKKIYWAVQLIGPNERVNDYFYEVEIFKPAFAKPTITFSSYCQPVDITNNDLFRHRICAATNIDCLNHMLDADQNLFYYIRVCKHIDREDLQKEAIQDSKKCTYECML